MCASDSRVADVIGCRETTAGIDLFLKGEVMVLSVSPSASI